MKYNLLDQQISGNRRVLEKDIFRFDCHPGVSCFNRCCKDADMYLYPYDVIRMKNRLGISSGQFLKQHTFQAFRDNPYFPNLMLKMSDDKDKSCRFLSQKGCSIYEDRPFSCRAYPLERAVARIGGEMGPAVCYFISDHSYCLGHNEPKEWTVQEWVEDQHLQRYNDMNDLWVDIDTIFRSNPWGPQGVNNPTLKMAFMACFNMDELRKFIRESTFLSRFAVPKERLQFIMESDVELMKIGFDWIKFFLAGKGPLTLNPNFS